jgi:hypothetical protein
MSSGVGHLRRYLLPSLALAAALTATGFEASRAAGASAGASAAPSTSPTAPADASQGGDPRWQMLGKYCEKCHNATDWTGGIAFDTMEPSGIPADAKTWEAAVRKLRGRMMPPPGEKQPDAATVDSFVSWMETHLDDADRVHPDPGYVALHRLNRTEYAREVERLLATKVDVSALLPKDTKSDGFDNVANVLKVSPTFLDQYITAARTVAGQAVGNPQAPKAVATFRAGPRDQAFHIEGLPLGTRGGMLADYNFPADGDYDFNISVFGGVGYIIGLDTPQRVILTIDDHKLFEKSMGGPQDLKEADQHPNEATKEMRERFQHIHAHVTAGPHQIGVAFVERSKAESDDWLQPFNPRGGMDRIARIGGLELTGPMNSTGITETPSRRKIFVCHPASAAEEQPCAQQILATLARAAYRRPVTDADLSAPLHFYLTGRQNKTFDAGIESAIVAILSSPKFLYRMEAVPQTVQVGTSFRISDIELASRLSFFLWSEGPDEPLLTLAAADQLHDPQTLATQVRRMLADPRSKSLVTNFAFQWLQLDGMDKIEPDPIVYPSFDEDLRTGFRKEMELFLDSILRQDHDVRELMSANYTFVNERLALHYGIPNVRGAQFRRVPLTDSHRFGLFGKGAILMGTSYANRTAPVLRGAWVLESVTGTPPHAPPPAVPALKENVPGAHAQTIRERMELHRTQASCAACHGIMDPIGLALENFDAMGAWHTKDYDTGIPIESATKLVDGTVVNGPDELRKALLARPDQFVQTLTEKLMTFALGRTVEFHDIPEVRSIVRDAAHENYRFSALVLGIVNSPQFQMKRVPDGAAGKPDQMTTQAANHR